MRKKVSILTSNHVTTFVSDQLDFLTYALDNHGIYCHQSKHLQTDSANILIENFTSHDVAKIERFKKKYDKVDLFCVLTEHFELRDGVLLLNDEPFYNSRSYIPNLYERFVNFFRLSPLFSGLVILNNSPQKQKIQDILPIHRIFSFKGFPSPSDIRNPLADTIKKNTTYVFLARQQTIVSL